MGSSMSNVAPPTTAARARMCGTSTTWKLPSKPAVSITPSNRSITTCTCGDQSTATDGVETRPWPTRRKTSTVTSQTTAVASVWSTCRNKKMVSSPKLDSSTPSPNATLLTSKEHGPTTCTLPVSLLSPTSEAASTSWSSLTPSHNFPDVALNRSWSPLLQ